MKEHTLKPNLYEVGQRQIDSVSKWFDVDQGIIDKLRYSKRELTVHFPAKMDDGSIRMFTGYRIQHNDVRGPAKGGDSLSPRCGSG